LLEDGHVFVGELAKAFVDGPADTGIVSLLAVNNILDVVIALIKALAKLPKIPLHQLSILQHLLILLHFLQAVGGQVFPLVAEDTHRVAVFLAVKEHIEAGCVQVVKSEFVWKLTKHWALLQVKGVYIQDLDVQLVVLKCWVELEDDWLLEGRAHNLVLDEKVSEVQYD